MLPPDTIVRAASRWIRLLRGSTFTQAANFIRIDPNYTDLTQTQYSSGLELLRTLHLVEGAYPSLKLSSTISGLPDIETNSLVFETILLHFSPAWLRDADLLIPDEAEVPADARGLAITLKLSDSKAFRTIRQLHGRIDLAQRALIGSTGERALVQLLEQRWPGSTTYIAQTDDGFGYDVLFRQGNVNWHLEVKTTTRRGRLTIYLSRHEYEVHLHDPNWRLIIVGLNDQLQLQAIATVRDGVLQERTPLDTYSDSNWQSVCHHLSAKDVFAGLHFLNDSPSCPTLPLDSLFSEGCVSRPCLYTWIPTATPS